MKTLPKLLLITNMAFAMGSAHGQTVDPAQMAQFNAHAAYQQQFAQLSIEERQCVMARAQSRQRAQQRKRGLNRLFSAISRTAVRTERFPLAQSSHDAASSLMTIDDLQSAARDLGLVPDDITACTRG